MSTARVSSAVAVARPSYLEAPPSLSLTVAGQVSMNQKQMMPLSFWKTEVLEHYELKFVAEPAAHTWVTYLKMLHKPQPEIVTVSIR